jgi:Helix-turn-helix domain
LGERKIEKPEEVYITVSPGLWTKHFLNRAGSKAKEALHQFGYLAKDILKIDPYHNELALRLAIQLTLDSRVRVRNQNPYDYRVISLLEEVLPRTEIDRALQDKHKARDLKNRWSKALQLLAGLGWQIEFDPETYPEWLRPDSDAPKPDDWRKIKVIDRLLQAKLTIKPPDPIPGLLARIKEPKRLKPVEAPPQLELTGEEIRRGRENRRWSRKELGGFLDLSADYIGKLERGDRSVTPELDAKLRKMLYL